MPERTHSPAERFIRTILASRFFTVSVFLHLIIVTLFGGKVLFNKYVQPPDFEATSDASGGADAPPPPPDTPENLPPPPTLTPPPPAPSSGLTAMTTVATGPAAFSMPLPAIAPPTISKNLNTQPSVQAFNAGTSVALPSSMQGRGQGNRAATGQKYGEKTVSEQAVLKALRWLQSQQNSDGTWGAPSYHDAFTGLALLCFLGHGETPQTSHEFGVTVTNAINALVKEAGQFDSHLCGKDRFAVNQDAYLHGICTYAVCEAYTMTKDDRLAPIIERAVGYILAGQRKDGGWAYMYDMSADDPKAQIKSDTSVSGWQIQALKAAHLTGIPGLNAKVRPALDLAMKNLDRVFNPKDGTFGYRKAGDKPAVNATLNGVGVLSKLFWLGKPDKETHEGLKNIVSKDLDYNAETCNLYTWYYNTQACYQAQEGPWSWWKDRFQNQLTGNQSPDGSWPPTCTKAPDPKKAGDIGGLAVDPAGDGPIYRTTLCTLMLEVFYRYLPSSQEAGMGGSIQGL